MLRHHNIVILFLVLLSSLIYFDARHTVHWSLYVLLVLLFLSVEFYGAYFIHSNFHVRAICDAKTKDKVISLSFDDGPAIETEKILEVLDAFNVKATFFCIGNHIKNKEQILKKIDAKGHLIGNHSYSHGFMFDLKTTKDLISDLEHCNREIERSIGKKPAFFRPPYGVTTPGLARAVKKLGLSVIGWNIRSLDTSIKDKQQVLQRIKSRLKPGAIILLHDTISGTELVLRELLTYLEEQQYKVVPLDQLIQKQAYV